MGAMRPFQALVAVPAAGRGERRRKAQAEPARGRAESGQRPVIAPKRQGTLESAHAPHSPQPCIRRTRFVTVERQRRESGEQSGHRCAQAQDLLREGVAGRGGFRAQRVTCICERGTGVGAGAA